MNLASNKMTGVLSERVFSGEGVVHLERLDLRENLFSGPLSPNIGEVSRHAEVNI